MLRASSLPRAPISSLVQISTSCSGPDMGGLGQVTNLSAACQCVVTTVCMRVLRGGHHDQHHQPHRRSVQNAPVSGQATAGMMPLLAL
ncbi:hypothetical protein BGZ61DRAFT_446322 [Ilyonectria robusta]|uniref:uncharacterized protein n=1 Tax=Ilyonectria robusta TaxID=1079257 RepID=UPI001E8EE8D8|nr:uncharacterized protein BGZ61DRAFT_446322 [Ilyonectria robusta]KAH8729403.1 hypothetical protein BGZ61DRAFT_446322 [Ilyonectria robusta]